jgi:hypothetical protein
VQLKGQRLHAANLPPIQGCGSYVRQRVPWGVGIKRISSCLKGPGLIWDRFLSIASARYREGERGWEPQKS